MPFSDEPEIGHKIPKFMMRLKMANHGSKDRFALKRAILSVFRDFDLK